MGIKLSLKKVGFITNKELVTYYKKSLDNNLFAIEMFLKQLDFNLSKNLEATIIFTDDIEDTELEFTPIIIKKEENNRFDVSKVIKDDLLSTSDNGLNKDIALKYYTQIATEYDNKKLEYEAGTYDLKLPELTVNEKKDNFTFPLGKKNKQINKKTQEENQTANIIKSTNEINEEYTESSKKIETIRTEVKNELEKEYLEIQKNMFTSNQELLEENKKLKADLKSANEDLYTLKNESTENKGILFPSVEDFSNPLKNPEISRLINTTSEIFEESNLLKKFGVDQELSVFDKVEAEFIKGKLNRQILLGLKETYLNSVERILSTAKEQLINKYSDIKGINVSDFVVNTEDYQNKKSSIENHYASLLIEFQNDKYERMKSQLNLLSDIHEKQIQALATKLKTEYMNEEKKLQNLLDIDITEFKGNLNLKQSEEIQIEKENMITISTESFYASSLDEREQIINEVAEKIRTESLGLTQSLDSAIEDIQSTTSSNHEMIKNKADIIIKEQESKEKLALERERVTLSNSQLKELEKELQSKNDELISTKEKYNALLSENETLRTQQNTTETPTTKSFFSFGK